ncbi:indolepyruvate oxidoreductase subunit beta [uncultured Methanomethylovorans sp.]|uniref:indolepyruvate oxidoreductase subunit beta n=1 Tax=uncultured Methanomethylovorans sp. TaxID=183759 RepID=UPI0026262D13|nr:indolepyruvate oxidoreductase subunit beta [uncultured Methanomethylovorans sp.]
MSSAGISFFDLVIAGVGGQGTILASDIIGKAAVKEGLPVMAAETHGMAQRGGSVVNHLRIGCEFGSLIPLKSADALLALEPSEALRYIEYLSDDGIVIVNTEPVLPVTVTSGVSSYPDIGEMIDYLEQKFTVKAFNAVQLAKAAGHVQSMNTVMIGAVSKYLPLSKDVLIECVRGSVPKKTVDINIKAFELGLLQA